MIMHIAIRADASANMGTGHLRRCISLAHALDGLDCRISIVCRRLDDVAAKVLRDVAWDIFWLDQPQDPTDVEIDASCDPPHSQWAGVTWSQDATETIGHLAGLKPDWMVIDHYAFDARWHDQVRDQLGCRVLVIDDLADRSLSADALLDQNFAYDHRTRYANVLRGKPFQMFGPRYALLGPAYRKARRYAMHDTVRSIGIFMGGTDPGGISSLILNVCREEAGFKGEIEVVSSSASAAVDELTKACMSAGNTRLTLDEPDLSDFFQRHDLHIGAGGGATWERCCIGPPTIAVPVASNQAGVVGALARIGALRLASMRNCGVHLVLPGSATAPDLGTEMVALMRSGKARSALSECAKTLVDGLGALRVALMLLRDTMTLRPARTDDAALLHAWRNHPTTREVSGNPTSISLAQHEAWLQQTIDAPDRFLFIALVGETPVGSIRFDQKQNTFTVSLYLNPDLMGLGLGSRMLETGELELQHRHGDMLLEANVIAGNKISQSLFSRSGYTGGPLHYSKRIAASAH